MKGICPICKAKEAGSVLSLKVWANLTQNNELLEEYRSCELNTIASSNIAFDSVKKVYWRKNGNDVMMQLNKVTVHGERPFSDKKEVNLSR